MASYFFGTVLFIRIRYRGILAQKGILKRDTFRKILCHILKRKEEINKEGVPLYINIFKMILIYNFNKFNILIR